MKKILSEKAILTETNFQILKNEKDKVIGYKMAAKSDFESKQFCLTFLRDAENGNMETRVGEGEIYFHNKRIHSFCVHPISETDSDSLKTLLAQTDKWNPIQLQTIIGFKLIAVT